MLNQLKKIRSVYSLNRVIALFLKKLKIKALYAKWPLKGIVKFDLLDQKLLFYSDCDDYLISGYYYSGFDEEIHEIECLTSIIKRGNIFFDIGSFNGLFSIVLGMKYPELNVFSFEPNPANFKRTNYNIELNKLDNISTFNMGISNKTGRMDFYLPKDMSMTTVSSFDRAFFYKHSDASSAKTEVEVISIDSFCVNQKIYPQLIKIDVEGHELEVILGAQQTIEKYKPIVLCEIFTKVFDTDIEFQSKLPAVHFINDLFKRLKYGIFVLKGGRLEPVDSLNYDSAGRNFLFIPQ